MTKPALNSLTTRIVCAVALILALTGGLVGYALYRNIRQSLLDEVRSQLNQRIAWVQASIELDEGKLDFENKQPHSSELRNWSVTTTDGKLLWSAPSDDYDSTSPFVQSRTITIGDPGGPKLTSADFKVLPHTENDVSVRAYSTGDKRGNVDLIVSAREPRSDADRELRRVALALWTTGPASLFALVLVLALFIRWQLAPLEEMSAQAAAIGPQNAGARIGPAGSSVELVQLRDALNSMLQRLADGMERERHFSSMAAHELRTPLTQMRLNVEIALSKERVNADYKEVLRLSLLDLDRLQNLVANLLFLTREHQGPEMNRDVSLSGIVQRAIKRCGSNAHVATELDGFCVLGNAELLECAVRNVLENALRYAPGAPAEIIAAQRGNTIEMQVTDCGAGVKEADRERIFEPLTRLDEARTIGAEANGFGLGLTVARNALRACGGSVKCAARSDQKPGAEFRFIFKAAPLDPDAEFSGHSMG